VARVVHALGAGIVAVLVGAIAVLVVGDPPVSSQAAPPRAAASRGALPTTVRPPAPAAARPVSPPAAAVRTSAAATHLSTGWGIDVSWPQCDDFGGGLAPPAVQPGFVAVGVNNGKPFTDNRCLPAELAYARSHTGFAAYLNIDAPRSGDAAAYGRKVALDGLARMARAKLVTPVVWLDVEVLNHWSSSGVANVAVINAALHTLQARHVQAGIYSSGPMWQQITGGARIGVPVWLATTVTDYRQLPQWCVSGLGGREAEMAQYVASDGRQLVDVDVLCPHAIPRVVGMFGAGRG